jgi:hypothetical protein
MNGLHMDDGDDNVNGVFADGLSRYSQRAALELA